MHRDDLLGVLGLGEDLQELVVGQEVEPREGAALVLEVVVEPLLHLLQQPGALLELLQAPLCRRHEGQALRCDLGLTQQALPCLVDLPKPLGLRGELPHDILGLEDGLKVQPVLLHRQPLLEDPVQKLEVALPSVDLSLEDLLEWRELQSLGDREVVVEHLLHVVAALHDVHPLVLVVQDLELHPLPLLAHLLQGLLDRVLLSRDLGDLHDGFLVHAELQGVHVLHGVQGNPGPHLEPQLLGEVRPVPVTHPNVSQGLDGGHDGLELVNLHLDVLGDLQDRGLVLEHSDGLVHGLPRRRDVPLHLLRVQSVKPVVHPRVVPLPPVIRGGPQRGVGLEVPHHGVELEVVRLLLLEQDLALVVQRGVLLALVELGLKLLHLRRDLSNLLDIGALVEASDDLAQPLDLPREGLLVCHHLLMKALAALLQVLLLTVDDLLELSRPPHTPPLFVEVLVSQCELELLQHAVELLHLLNRRAQVGSLRGNCLEVFLLRHQGLDVRRDLLRLRGNLSESFPDVVGLLLGHLGDQL
eukprot:RCo053604